MALPAFEWVAPTSCGAWLAAPASSLPVAEGGFLEAAALEFSVPTEAGAASDRRFSYFAGRPRNTPTTPSLHLGVTHGKAG